MRAIMAMIGGTRHDCVLGSTAVMRLGTAEAIHWAAHREAFGRQLIDQPAMTGRARRPGARVRGGDGRGAAARAGRTSRPSAATTAAELLRRIAAPVLKYWTCKRAPAHAAEALECQGGFGYIEESRLARAYREAPLMSIWEGSGNVQALDVLRAAGARARRRSTRCSTRSRAARGADARLDAALDADRAGAARRDGEAQARGARRAASRAASRRSLLVRHAPPAVADAFCATRLGARRRARAFGELPPGTDARGDRRARASGRDRASRHEGRRDPAARRARRGRAQPRAPRGPDRPGRARARARGDLPAREHDDAEPLPPQHALGARGRSTASRWRCCGARRASTTASSAAASSRSAARDTRGTYALVEPDGSAYLHDKDQPSFWENNYYAAGSDDGVAETSLGPIGLRQRLRVGPHADRRADARPRAPARRRHALPVVPDLDGSRGRGSGTATTRRCSSTRARRRPDGADPRRARRPSLARRRRRDVDAARARACAGRRSASARRASVTPTA